MSEWFNWPVFCAIMFGWYMAKMDSMYGAKVGAWLAECTKSVWRWLT